MVVHHAGPVGDDRFADHRGNSNQVPSRGDCCCWPGRPSRELQPGPHGYPGGRCPTTVVLLPVSYFPNALRTHKRTHCERMIRTSLAAAGYHGGRHSWNAELSWVPLRPFDRSPPMGTVLTVDRLSLLRRCVSELPKALYHFRGGALAFSAIPGYSLPCRCGSIAGSANFAFWRVLFFGSLQAPLIA
jgi:hypothetical protein